MGRAGKVLRRLLGLSDETSAISDEVIAAAKGRDPRRWSRRSATSGCLPAGAADLDRVRQGLGPPRARGAGGRAGDGRREDFTQVESPAGAVGVGDGWPIQSCRSRQKHGPRRRRRRGHSSPARNRIDAHPAVTAGTLVAGALIALVLFHRFKKGN